MWRYLFRIAYTSRMSAVGRPLRADAERNRQRILQAARELFAERGLDVTLDDVADRAGLGVGTVYRRFRSRDELVDALFEERLLTLVSVADEALARKDPWEGLIGFLEELARRQAADRGLKEVALGSNAGRERVAQVREQMRPRGEELVRRAQAAGKLRPDLDASDLPLLEMMMAAISDLATAERPEIWRRFFALVVDGLRAEGGRCTPLPEAPLGFEALDQVMCHWRPARWHA